MKYRSVGIVLALACAGIGLLALPGRTSLKSSQHAGPAKTVEDRAIQKFEQGRHIFRFDTFGDEGFWGDSLKLHRAIEGSKF